jgi:hypothetical protein
MNDVITFLRAFADAECQTRTAKYVEPDDKKYIKQMKAWDAMFGGDLSSGLSRPRGAPASKYASADYVEAAERVQPRTVFAVARYKHGKSSVYRAWMGDSELGSRGEGMTQNLYVEKDGGELKVVAVYDVCSNCMGSGTAGGKSCSACDGGWVHRNGATFKKLGAPAEVKKLKPPSDPVYKPAYDAIEEPA